MPQVRAKFTVAEVTKMQVGKKVLLVPVTHGSPENDSFFKWTPYGKIEMGTINEDVSFEPGEEYYIDFTLAKVNP